MIRTTLALLLLLASSRPVLAQHQQPHCGNVAYPWQGIIWSGPNPGTHALDTSVWVPAATIAGDALVPGSVYPVDIWFPDPTQPQPTRFSLISWAHQFPEAPGESIRIRGYVETWPRQVSTAAQESNHPGDLRFVTKNLSMPLTPGMHYTVGIQNNNFAPVQVHLAVTVQVCFSAAWELENFRMRQAVPGLGAAR